MVAGRTPWRNEILERLFGLPDRISGGRDGLARMRREPTDFRGGDFLDRFAERDALDIVVDVPAALVNWMTRSSWAGAWR
jgi:hypothetical protein